MKKQKEIKIPKALVINVPKKRNGVKMVFPFKMGIHGVSNITLNNPFKDSLSKIIIVYED